MRNLLIALVLILTGATFYSALWFKSEKIEDDITARVTDDLGSKADDIDIDVDGRHVTLTGVVYDAAVEESLLGTADETFGALGPIDGLTFQQGAGYVNAIKTETGITLRGSVPTEDARADLVAKAQAATDGSVADELIVSGPDGTWTGEAAFGVTQLAGLTAGTLTAAAGAYTLSGTASEGSSGVDAAISDRAGWTSLISTPVIPVDLSGEVARLNADVAERDISLGVLQSSLSDRDSSIATLKGLVADKDAAIANKDATIAERTQERDTTRTELADLRASLTENEAGFVTLREELASAQSDLGAAKIVIDEKDEVIAGLEADIAAGQTALDSTDGQKDSLAAALRLANEAKDDLSSDVADRDAKIVSLQDEASAAKAASSAEIASLGTAIDALNGTVSERDATIEALRSQSGSESTAQQCAAQATNALEGSRINFVTASAEIETGSVPLLERLTGIALACVSEGLSVEVGGHTDSQGSNADNQSLSEARAQSIVDFMAERGVPTNGLRAVGFGEDQPIASNTTAEGRAQNRRISFDWQSR